MGLHFSPTRVPCLRCSNHSVRLSRKGWRSTRAVAHHNAQVAKLCPVQRSSQMKLYSPGATMRQNVHAITAGLALTAAAPLHEVTLQQCPTKGPSISTPARFERKARTVAPLGKKV